MKANIHTVGVSGMVVEGDCEAFADGIHNVESVLNDAYHSGKWTEDREWIKLKCYSIMQRQKNSSRPLSRKTFSGSSVSQLN